MTGTNKSQQYPITAVPEDIFWYYNRLLDEYNVDPLSSVTVNFCIQNNLEHGLELLTDVKDEKETVSVPLCVLATYDPSDDVTAYLHLDAKIKRVRVRQRHLVVLRTIQKQFQTHQFFVPISLIIESILFMTNSDLRKWILGQLDSHLHCMMATLKEDGKLGEAALVYRDDNRHWKFETFNTKQLPAPTVVVFDPHEADKAQLYFAK